jgi:hypothetical protein
MSPVFDLNARGGTAFARDGHRTVTRAPAFNESRGR